MARFERQGDNELGEGVRWLAAVWRRMAGCRSAGAQAGVWHEGALGRCGKGAGRARAPHGGSMWWAGGVGVGGGGLVFVSQGPLARRGDVCQLGQRWRGKGPAVGGGWHCVWAANRLNKPTAAGPESWQVLQAGRVTRPPTSRRPVPASPALLPSRRWRQRVPWGVRRQQRGSACAAGAAAHATAALIPGAFSPLEVCRRAPLAAPGGAAAAAPAAAARPALLAASIAEQPLPEVCCLCL